MFEKREFTVIQRALRDRHTELPLGGVWLKVYEEAGLGRAVGATLHMEPDDLDQLRQFVKQQTGADPLHAEVPENRLDATAEGFRDEKWARKSVFDGMALVARRGGVKLSCGTLESLPGTLLLVSLDDVCLDGIRDVVVIENGSIARRWADCRFPDELRSTLLIYRGHGLDVRTIRDWLSALPRHVRKVGYFDFDPAGVGLAHELGVDAMLVPARRDDLPLSSSANKPDSHTIQMARRASLCASLAAPARELLTWMSGTKCAVTQEWITASNWPLNLVWLRSET